MAGIGDALKNPIVLFGGLGLGLVVLLTKGSGGGNAVVGVDPSVINANVALNKTAAASQIQLAQIDGDVAKARIAAGVASNGYAMQYLTAQAQAGAVVERERVISSAAVVNTMVAAQSAQIIDAQQNMARLGFAQIEANRSVTVAREQGTTERYKAKKAAQSSLFSSIAGVAKAGISAATGIPIAGGDKNGQGAPASGSGINWGGTPMVWA